MGQHFSVRRNTDREFKFIAAMIRTNGNRIVSIKESGYTGKDPRTAAQYLMGKPKVREALGMAKQELPAHLKALATASVDLSHPGFNKMRRAERLAEIAFGRAMTRVQDKALVVNGPNGPDVLLPDPREEPFPPAVQVRALELLGKMFGDYVDVIKISGDKEAPPIFIRIDNGRGPERAITATVAPEKPLAAEIGLCLKCGEAVEGDLAAHELGCPGA